MHRAAKNTYCINIMQMGFDAAEAYCNTLGGHLPSYQNADEQREVETNYTRMGYLIGPSQVYYYWMGLTGQGVGWPNFSELGTLNLMVCVLCMYTSFHHNVVECMVVVPMQQHLCADRCEAMHCSRHK